MLVSPAERPPLNSLGTVSSVPEQYGSDFLIHSPTLGLIGVQRKELKDLVASLSDDRFSREVIDMKQLDIGVWLIEGVPQWDLAGELLSTRISFTQMQLYGIMFSLQSQGFWILRSAGITETVSLLSNLERWAKKTSHTTLNKHSTARGVFGQPDTTELQIHFWMGLPGMGYTRARDVVNHYGGLPVCLKSGVKLTDVSGVGPKTAKKIEELLGD